MNKAIVVATVAASLGGLGAGALIAAPHLAGAADNGGVGGTSAAPAAGVDHAARLASVLKPLVDKGTITQAQADAVSAALVAARPADGGGGGGHGHGRFGGMPGGPMMGMGAGLDVIAKALGMTADELRTAVKGGSTITQIAATKNVSIDTIVKAVVAELTTKITDAVKAGKMTQAEADKVLANVTTRATDMVNGSELGGGSRGRGGPQGRPGGPKDQRGTHPDASATTAAGS